MTITKAHLINSIQEKLELPKSRSTELIESLFEIIKGTLENGQDILISGFGKFCVKEKTERRGSNTSSGRDMMLESRIVTFKCSNVLKDKLNGRIR